MLTDCQIKDLAKRMDVPLERVCFKDQLTQKPLKYNRSYIVNMENEYGRDYELFMKKKEKYCSTKVKTLLFDKFLTKIANEKNKIQTITMFYR